MSTRGRRLPVNSAAHSLLPQRASAPNSRVRGRTIAVYVRGHFQVAFSVLFSSSSSGLLVVFCNLQHSEFSTSATGNSRVHEGIVKNWIKKALAGAPARLALPNNNCRFHKLCFLTLYLSLSLQKRLDADNNWWQIERKSCFGVDFFYFFGVREITLLI
jgi:hypothetical protein